MLENIDLCLRQLNSSELSNQLKLLFQSKDHRLMSEFKKYTIKVLDNYKSVQEAYLLLNALIEIGELEYLYYLLQKRIFELNKIGKVEIEFYLAITKLLGKRKEFHEFFYAVVQDLIVEKNYGLYHKIFETYHEDVTKSETLYAIKLLVAIEEKDVDSIEKIYLEIREKILAEQVKINTIKQLYLILEQFNGDDVRVYQYKTFMKCILHLYGEDICEALQLIDYVFLTQEVVDLLIVHSISPSHTAKEMLELYLSDKVTIKNRDDHKLYQKLDYFSHANKRIKMTVANSNRIEDGYEHLPEVKQLNERREINFEVPEKYIITSDEQAMLSYDFKDVSIDLIISMISSDYFSVAMQLLNRLEKDLNYYYLKAELLYRMNKYSDVVILANDTISKINLRGQDRYPFEFLKAKAFNALGDFEKSKKCYDIAKQIEQDSNIGTNIN